MAWWSSLRLHSSSPDARRKAVEALAAQRDSRAMELLLRSLSDADAGVRCAAARGLGTIPEAATAATALVKALVDPDTKVRGAAADALGRLGIGTAAKVLVRTMRDTDPEVRWHAAAALNLLHWRPETHEEQELFELAMGRPRTALRPGEAVLTTLVKDLKHETSFLRRAAAEALTGVNDPRCVRPLVSASQDADPTVRVSAIYALSRRADEQAKDALLHSLGDADPHVRLAAAEVLEQHGDPAHTEYFIRLLEDENYEVRIRAIQFVRRIGDPEIAHVLVPLLQDRDSDVRLAAAQALGAIRNPIAVEALVIGLTDEERAIRQAAANALEQIDPNWPSLEAAQSACARIDLLLQDPRPWVSSAASQVLTKLRVAASTIAGQG